MSDFDEFGPMESRPRDSNPAGKCTERLETLLPPETYDAITAQASLHRMSKSEYVRSVMERHLFGVMDWTRARLGEGSRG